jgi:N-acetylneuraminic acid mutarotase
MRPILALLLVAILNPPAGVGAQTPVPSSASKPSSAQPSLVPAPEGTWFTAPVWSRLPVDRGPAAREDATWTVDADGASAYLFGGRDGKTTFDDLWRFDLATDTWTRLRSDSGPSARFGHSAAWALGTGLVVFGGQRETAFFDDLWAYDPATDRWRKLPRDGQAPAARYGTCATIDRDGRFVISHGFTSNGRFDDTRAYDFDRERWVAITPAGRRPGERCLHDCFLDASDRLVLYGGQDNGSRALGDLWRLGEERWTRSDDPPPSPRRLYAATQAGPDVWLFGGAGRDDRVLEDLWRVDRASLSFTRVRPDGPMPSGRSAAVLVADPLRRRILLFGGTDRRAFDDVWQLADPVSSSPTPTPLETPSRP